MFCLEPAFIWLYALDINIFLGSNTYYLPNLKYLCDQHKYIWRTILNLEHRILSQNYRCHSPAGDHSFADYLISSLGRSATWIMKILILFGLCDFQLPFLQVRFRARCLDIFLYRHSKYLLIAYRYLRNNLHNIYIYNVYMLLELWLMQLQQYRHTSETQPAIVYFFMPSLQALPAPIVTSLLQATSCAELQKAAFAAVQEAKVAG